MFIIDLDYLVPLERLDKSMAAHVKFLNIWYKKNVFIASGRKVPRTGGIILALASSKEEIHQLIKSDPFHKQDLAKFTVTEFMTSRIHPSFKDLLSK